MCIVIEEVLMANWESAGNRPASNVRRRTSFAVEK
jgi:hypothetical protein